MTSFEWSEAYAVGIPRIDREHRELFRCVDSFHAACRENNGEERIEQTLHFLLHYVITHFKGEEDQMAAARYTGLESHRKEHEDLLREVRERVKALHEGKTFPLDGFSRFLQTWLVSHVSEKDTAFASWLKKLPEISPKG